MSDDPNVQSNLTRFGNSDLLVSTYCQGTANGIFARNEENSDGRKILEYCLDIGVNFFDSSNAYNYGASEVTLGKFLKSKRDKIVICTKVAPWVVSQTMTTLGDKVLYTPEFLKSELDGALARLDTDYIDIYMLHHSLIDVSYEDVADTMHSMVQAGKVRYWGVSNNNSQEVLRHISVCEDNDNTLPIGLENCYGIGNTPQGDDLFPVIKKTGLGFVTCRPHSGGRLFHEDKDYLPGTPGGDLIDLLKKISLEIGTTLTKLCIAWSLSKPEITSVLSAAETYEHVSDNVGGTNLHLSSEILSVLNSASKAFTDYKLVENDHINGRWVNRDKSHA